MKDYQPWLPLAAIERAARDASLRQVVADWSSKWFARQPATLAGDPVLTTVPEDSGGSGWAVVEGLSLVPSADAEGGMVSLLYGPQESAHALTEPDEAALRTVVESCVADLRARLTVAFHLAANSAWRPAITVADAERRWIWHIKGYRGAALFRVVANEALIVRNIRAGLPPATRERPLGSLHVALAGHSLSVSALVGRCRVTTAELADMGEGDVLLLDRMVSDPADLAVDRDLKPMLCTVDERDGRLNLTLRLMDRANL